MRNLLNHYSLRTISCKHCNVWHIHNPHFHGLSAQTLPNTLVSHLTLKPLSTPLS